MGISPSDGAVWYAKFSPFNQTGLVCWRHSANPPETCKTEYFEPPSTPRWFAERRTNVRGVEVDCQGRGMGGVRLGPEDRALRPPPSARC